MTDLLILAQSVIDEGFFDNCDGGCVVVFALVGLVLGGLLVLVSRTRRRSEEAYWERRHREEERRWNDPDMAPPNDE